MAAITLPRRSLSAGLKTASAPSCLSFSALAPLRDNPTTVRPIDLPSNTDATPTPPDAPVTSSTEPAGGGAAGSLHCVSACHAVRNTSGAPAISSALHPCGIGARLAAGATTISASVPRTLTPTPHRRMPAESPTFGCVTPGPAATTSPTASRPNMCGNAGLAGYIPRARNASAGFSAA